MFDQTSQFNTFEIGTNKHSMNVRQEFNPQNLRSLWVDHLVNEQQKLNKEYAQKHPLAVEFQSRKFFAQ